MVELVFLSPLDESYMTEPTPISQPFIKLDFSLRSQTNSGLLLTDFCEIITTDNHCDVADCLRRVEEARSSGNYVAGFVAYEAAEAMDSSLITHRHDASMPLLWFGVCKRPQVIRLPEVDPSQNESNSSELGKYRLSEWTAQLGYQDYSAAFNKIKNHLCEGDTYQLNLTFPLTAAFSGSVAEYYEDLKAAQSSQYNAWIHTGYLDILSLSPELFFHVKEGTIVVRPMKGTRHRGKTTKEDCVISKELASNPKDRAENVMIVDLLRNDLGRIARIGSVHVTSLFDIEIYPTVIQLTSSIRAKLKKETALVDIFKALFPSGSIVGAPKVKTMALINQFEQYPRGVYCGAVGCLTPQGDTIFNVAIRTLTLRNDGIIDYPVGSGIVADSDPVKEYDECLLKADLLKRMKWPIFRLLETLLFRPDSGFYLLLAHLNRLKDSADYFGFKCDLDTIRKALVKASQAWDNAQRVRLLVDKNSRIEIQRFPLAAKVLKTIQRVAFARTPVDSSNPFLYHKTTHRSDYEHRLQEISKVDDVILFNERGEVTESTIANIVVQIESKWYTPPIECGLLGGTKRAEMLATGELIERVLTVNEVKNANMVTFINSVRGQYPVQLLSACADKES